MANNLPRSDTFADDPINNNSGPRWTKPGLWIPTLMWSGAPAIGAHLAEWGVVHNANGGATAYGAATPSNAQKYMQAHVLRDAPTEDVSVKALFRANLFSTTWPDIHSSWKNLGVCARMTGAANTTLTAASIFDEGINGPTFYCFLRRSEWSGAADNYYTFVKAVRAGASSTVTTLLDTLDNTYPWNSGRARHDSGNVAGVRMTVTTSASTAELRGYQVLNDGTEVLVLSYDDSSSAIVETGLPGFVIESESTDSAANKWSWSCLSCEITDGTDVLARDEFLRSQIGSAAAITPHTGFGSAGFCVNSKYTGDQFGGTVLPDWDDKLVRGVSTTLDVTGSGGMHVMYDPASSPYIQARRLTFQFPSGTGSDRSAGVLLRMSLAATARHNDLSGSGKSGYGLIVNVDTAGTVWTAYIYRWSGTAEIIATRVLNQTGDGFTASVGTYMDLDLHAENISGGNKTVGNVHLEPIFDAVKLTEWTLADGVIENDDGTITDQASSRVLSGNGNGFFAQDNEGLNVVRISDWDQLTITDDADTNDQVSVTFDFEKTGASQTLTVPVEWPVEEETKDYVDAKRMEVGYTQMVPLASLQRRKWRVHSDAAKTTEADALLAFFRSIGGWDEPFFWVTDADETVTVLMDKDSLVVKKIDRQTWTFDMTLIEMING